MKITFWGVRGSIPVSGFDHLRYGGNTACVSVAADDRILILDAGTGIRTLGRTLAGTHHAVYLLLTHRHWDHVSGFPFFQPLMEPGRTIHLLDLTVEGKPWSVLQLLDGVFFPATSSDLASDLVQVEGDALAFLAEEGFFVRKTSINHPGGGFGYRIEGTAGSFVYLPDNELIPPDPEVPYDVFVEFCREADVLCHDAQYIHDDLPLKHGWGHSLVHQACKLAIDARVAHLVLFHHDPDRTDEAVDRLQEQARRMLAPHGIACTAAREGMEFDL